MKQGVKIMILMGLVVALSCILSVFYEKFHKIEIPVDPNRAVEQAEVDRYLAEAERYLPHGFDEARAVDVAMDNSEKWTNMRAEAKGGMDTLCVTFIELPVPQSNRYLDNMKNEGTKSCFWIYIVYRYDESNKGQLLSVFKEQVSMSFALMPESDIPKFDVIFAPPRTEILSSIYGVCKSLENTEHFAAYQMSDSCQALGAAVMTMHTTTGIAEPGNFNVLVYPKVILFMQLLPFLDKHRFVWIMDGDVSVDGFDLKDFLKAMHCSLPHVPLVAQPLVGENTQSYKFFNKKSWQSAGAVAAQTGFIEVQVPMIDSVLFRYYLLSFVLPLVIPAHILGADWGFDQLFCSVAKIFDSVTTPHYTQLRQIELPDNLLLSQSTHTLRKDRSHAGSPKGNRDNALKQLITNRALFKASTRAEEARMTAKEHRVAQGLERTKLLRDVLDSAPSSCAVVLGSIIHHENTQETNHIIGYDVKKGLNTRMMNIVERSFPSFYLPGKGAAADPLHKDSELLKSSKMREKCEF